MAAELFRSRTLHLRSRRGAWGQQQLPGSRRNPKWRRYRSERIGRAVIVDTGDENIPDRAGEGNPTGTEIQRRLRGQPERARLSESERRPDPAYFRWHERRLSEMRHAHGQKVDRAGAIVRSVLSRHRERAP